MATTLADLPQEIQDLVTPVSDAITGTILGRERTAIRRERDIAEAAVIECYGYAPQAPIPTLREAAIRLSGWMLGTRPHAVMTSAEYPSQTKLTVQHQSAATANGLRASGASAALSRYVVRRAGAI